MESHILNSYHQARYRIIGQVVRSTSDSLSSEGSCHQTSPEYPRNYNRSFEEESNDGEYWDQSQKKNWHQVQAKKTLQNNSSSSDEEDINIEVQEVTVNDKEPMSNNSISEADNGEDTSLVEGDDYDVIQVYAVHPDLDLEEASSEEDIHTSDDEQEAEDYCIDNHESKDEFSSRNNSIAFDDGLNIDTPVVSNVDEYFIKQEKVKENILEVKDEPLYDVDEFFIKNDKPKTNVEDCLVKSKSVEPDTLELKHIPNVDELFTMTKASPDKPVISILPEVPLESGVSTTETDLEVLPKIEELKRFLLDDTLSYSKFKTMQRSCSVPHSPLHNICMDIEDAKTCLSFEDLNLDLSDLTFDTDKEKSSSSGNKSDDIPHILTEDDVNSFLITNNKPQEHKVIPNDDDFHSQDMELDCPIVSIIPQAISPIKNLTSTPVKAKPQPTVLDYCIEKPEKKIIKKEAIVIKKEAVEIDDFVDVESCNDTMIPVLAANNLSSLLEQFEANEKINCKKKPVIKIEDFKVNKNSLINGTRLQDAGVHLNKNKMRHILMPSTINTTIRRSPSPVHSDHDYCSSKKRHSLPTLKGGQSLLKPEVLSSNNKILNSRHRSCKNKKIIYHLSSDDEGEKSNNKNKKLLNNKNIDLSENKVKKLSVKAMIKPPEPPNCRKKNLPIELSTSEPNTKSNNSVMFGNASKASDNSCSQNQSVSIKLTIKNKCEVIFNRCDDKDTQKYKDISKVKSNNVVEKLKIKTESIKAKSETPKVVKTDNVKSKKSLDRSHKNVGVSVTERVAVPEENIKVKEESRPTAEFYNALFSNKQDVHIPSPVEVKSEKRPNEEDLKVEIVDPLTNYVEQPQKRKKLNLQEYKMRKVASSNNSSAAVSPEAIFPEMLQNCYYDKTPTPVTDNIAEINNAKNSVQLHVEEPKKIFDPIREASRKILMITKKQKADAIRKRDENIVMSKIPKVENLELQPLISDAEMMKIVGMTQGQVMSQPIKNEKPQLPTGYEEIILVSVGTNTDDKVFKELAKYNQVLKSPEKLKIKPPPQNNSDYKNAINFKIKKNDHILKQNVFDKRDGKSPINDAKQDSRIDKERYRDITATLKSVGKQVDNKMLSNSLFASIQDVVMKKAPENDRDKQTDKRSFKHCKTVIVRDYDLVAEHGEDKIIHHLAKNRNKPELVSIIIQTVQEVGDTPPITNNNTENMLTRKRTDSDMSMSSGGSPVQVTNSPKIKVAAKKYKEEIRRESHKRSRSKDYRSRSRERYDRYRSSRSVSRTRRRRTTYSRSRSRSHGRFRRYKRSDSPYRRKRRSRSSYRSRQHSRSSRDRSRPKSRLDSHQNKSPIPKMKRKPSPVKLEELKAVEPVIPPLRKSTVSESSESSTSSSSSSSSSSSNDSRISRISSTPRPRSRSRSFTPKSRRSLSPKSGRSLSSNRRSLTPRNRSGTPDRRSCSPFSEFYKKKGFGSAFSSDDRELNTPVEERRIVFVGKLEKDITKVALRCKFSKFGPVVEVRLHNKEDGTRYGFVTFKHARDAWQTVESASSFPQYDVGFGGRRAFCRQSYADLDGIEARYTESVFHGQPPAILPPRRNENLSFEQMLLEMKNKLSQRKNDKLCHDDTDV